MPVNTMEPIPYTVYRYLLPHERQVLTVRRHPAALIPPAASAVGGLLAAAAVTPFGASGTTVETVVWLLAGGLLAQFAAAIYGWFDGYVVVTRQRIIFVTTTILGRRVEQFPVEQAKELEVKRSSAGRLAGYASFVFEFDGPVQRVIEFLPYPDQLYLELQGLIFPDPADDE